MTQLKASDEILMCAVRDGHLESMKILFERYHVKLYNFFVHLTRNQALSEDLTQTVFYRILRYRHTFKEAYKFRSWMYQLGRNALADHFKKQKLLISDFDEVEAQELYQNSILEEIEKNDRYKILHCSLARLSDQDQELLILSRFQNLKYEEISQICGLSVSAIKTRIHRAIKKLKDYYVELEKL